MGLFLPKRWTRQPQYKTPIDPKWYSVGLNLALVPFGDTFKDFSVRNAAVTNGVRTSATYRDGIGLLRTSGDTEVFGINNTQTFSRIAIIKPSSVSGSQTISDSVITGSSGAQFKLSGAQLELNKSGIANIGTSTGAGLVAGQTHVVGVTYTGTAVTFFVDGRQLNTVNTTDTFTIQSQGILFIAGNASEAYSGLIGLHLDFNKPLSNDVMRDLTANPWQVFKAVSPSFAVPSATTPPATSPYLAWFDSEMYPLSWFDPELYPEAWFDSEFINPVTGGGTDVTSTGETGNGSDSFDASITLTLNSTIETGNSHTFDGIMSFSMSSTIETGQGSQTFDSTVEMAMDTTAEFAQGNQTFDASSSVGSVAVTSDAEFGNGSQTIDASLSLNIDSTSEFGNGVTFDSICSLTIDSTVETGNSGTFDGTITLSISATIETGNGSQTFDGIILLPITSTAEFGNGSQSFSGLLNDAILTNGSNYIINLRRRRRE